MDPLVIPAPDAMPLPAPVWLLKALLLLTFFLHVVPMNLVLGGSIATLVTELLGRKRNSAHHQRLARSFARMLPVATAFTITLGVAPLLFLQVLYGQLFYTATVLMAWPWLAVIALVTLAYYGFYLSSYRWEALAGARAWVVAGSALLLAAVALTYTNAATLMLAPERFHAVYTASAAGTHWNTAEATLVPRLLHFLVGATAVTGAIIVVYALGKVKGDQGYGRWALRYGAMWFAAATILQMAVGVWFLVSLPHEVMMLFMGQSILATVLLGAGLTLPMAGILLLVLASRSETPRAMALGGIAVLALILVTMTLMRDIVRDGFLSGKFDPFQRAVEPQWPVVALFAVFLVAALGTVVWMVRKAVARPKPAAS